MMTKTFVSVDVSEYEGGSKCAAIEAPFATVRAVLGEPWYRTDPNYPDDDYKTDVCWCVRSTENPTAIVTVWNYKNGPAYNGGEGSIEEIDYFSVYYSDAAFWNEIQALLAAA